MAKENPHAVGVLGVKICTGMNRNTTRYGDLSKAFESKIVSKNRYGSCPHWTYSLVGKINKNRFPKYYFTTVITARKKYMAV